MRKGEHNCEVSPSFGDYLGIAKMFAHSKKARAELGRIKDGRKQMFPILAHFSSRILIQLRESEEVEGVSRSNGRREGAWKGFYLLLLWPYFLQGFWCKLCGGRLSASKSSL